MYYFCALSLVIIVDIMGHNAMGATRWFRIGALTIQPSEIMKISTVFALARYFYRIDASDVSKIRFLIIPVFLIEFLFSLEAVAKRRLSKDHDKAHIILL
jgi:rod shape determining protein RodA